jgi:hypothetical protein
MKVVVPIGVTEAKLTSSNVTEDDYAAWVAGTYTLGQRVIYELRFYEAAVASTTDQPDAGAALRPPTWLDLGATNRWRMFDNKIGTQTVKNGSVEVSIKPGERINSIGLFNLVGRSVTVVVTDPVAGEIYRRAETLSLPGATNWWEYFFSPIPMRSDVVFSGIPAYTQATITITVDNTTFDAAVGHVALGMMHEIGATLHGTSVGIKDYSRKVEDDFGDYELKVRDYSNRAEYDVTIYTNQAAYVRRKLAAWRAKPVIWIGHEEQEATITFGYFRDFDIVIAGPQMSDLVITVEGLT